MTQDQAHTTKHTFCRICEAACGLTVDLNEQGAVVAIAPNEQHIASKGYACLKAEHGGEAIGLYLGNPISVSFVPPVLSDAFVKAFGSSKRYHIGSQDCNNKFVVAARKFSLSRISTLPAL